MLSPASAELQASQMHPQQDSESDQKIELTTKCLAAVRHYQGPKRQKRSQKRGPQSERLIQH